MKRQRITPPILESFMRRVGEIVRHPSTIYLTGGATAVLLGFREGTIDIDLAGDVQELFSAIPQLKLELNINIELAKPTDFVPGLPGEDNRHVHIGLFGQASFYHFDPYGQVFSKLVRGHVTDMLDARSFVARGWVDPDLLADLVGALPESDFYPYPRLDREAVLEASARFARQK